MAKKDHLYVLIDGRLENATLIAKTVAADAMGPAHKKYFYEVGHRQMAYGYTRPEALTKFLTLASERDWKVLQPLN